MAVNTRSFGDVTGRFLGADGVSGEGGHGHGSAKSGVRLLRCAVRNVDREPPHGPVRGVRAGRSGPPRTGSGAGRRGPGRADRTGRAGGPDRPDRHRLPPEGTLRGDVPQQRSPSCASSEAPAPSLTTCDRCGARAEWRRTVRGRWVLLETGELAAGLVPAGRRWRVAGDGTVVNLGSAVPSDTCRVTHFDVCPARPASADARSCSRCGGATPGARPDPPRRGAGQGPVRLSPAGRGPRWRCSRRRSGRRRSRSPRSASGSRSR
ncbi:DUF6083 domain-containing protein [Streptomyces diastatochromogenes]|nr:DUF6083 domain-containing protein [Streptomyces diastatochromogenes]